MSHRPRLVLLLMTALVALVVVACGGEEDKATPSSEPNELLKQTFAEGNPTSGKLHVSLKLDGAAAGAAAGPISLTLDGPFESGDPGTLPRFAMDAAFSGAGQSLKAGATSTGDKGFVSLNGEDYAVSDEVFAQFKSGYEQAVKQGNRSGQQSLSSLGIDPRTWLKDPRNEGEAKVGDEDTIKVSGDIDVDRMLDDVSKATAQTRALGVPGLEDLPSQLTPEQRKQAAEAIESVSAALYTGTKDTILRRMHVNVALRTQGGQPANLDFDLSYADVNEEQDIGSPSDPKPFDELASRLQALAKQAAGTASSGSSSSGGDSEELREYTDCVAKAGDDSAKVRACGDLLTTP